VWLAATLLDKGDPSGRTAALRALAAAHRAVRFVTDNAVQLLGGSGYVQEYPVEKWMRDAQAQVGLYGREGELMHDLGAAILGADEQEGGAT
jgi:alkylation response protein AidB-like acyl-CoA dehydrogenase